MSKSKALTIKETNELAEVVGSYHLDDISDLKKLDTEFIITIARSIISITKRISEGAEFSKQYELGKVFNAASLSAKLPETRVKIKDIQEALGFPVRTWYFHIEFYLDNTNFNKILSLKSDPKITAPKYTVNRALKGNDSEDKLLNYISICEYMGREPKVKEVISFNKKAATISEEVWTVTADEVKSIDEAVAKKAKEDAAKKAADGTTVPTVPEKSAYEKLDQNEKNDAMNEYYFEKNGVDVRELASDNEIEFIRTVPMQMFEIIKSMDQSEWKTMFRKGAKQFNSDTGKGTDKEAMLWRAFANVVEDAYNNVEYEEKEDFFKLHNDAMRSIKEDTIKEWYNARV